MIGWDIVRNAAQSQEANSGSEIVKKEQKVFTQL